MANVVSFNPETFTSGAFLDDEDVTITAAEFRVFEFGGSGYAGPALMVTYKTEDGAEHEQAYSAGSIDKFEPSDDGESLVPTPENKSGALSQRSNLSKWLQSVLAAGFPPEEMAKSKASVFVGLKCHIKSEVIEPAKGDRKERSLIIVDSIIGDEKPKSSSNNKTETKSSPSSGSGDSGATDVSEETVALVTEILMEAGGELTIQKLIQGIMPKIQGNPNKREIGKLVSSKKFRKEHFNDDGKNISL